MSFIIYGANGYTGQLTVEYAIKKGVKPTIAGRNELQIKSLAEKHGLNYKIFDLSNTDVISENIQGYSLVLHCAGPFSETARPMMNACIQSGVHYIDITGEIAILEWAHKKSELAKSNKVMLMCGVGFDLVPTDCVAKKLKEEFPNATNLELAFYLKGGSISRGTMLTMANNFGNTSYERRNGNLVEKPLGFRGKNIDFGVEEKFCMSIPWGDLYTSWLTTGIENITTFTTTSKLAYYALKMHAIINPIMRSGWFKRIFKNYIRKNITGPTPEQNKNGRSYIRGTAWNENKKKTVLLECPESYQITAQCSILIAQKVLNNDFKPGFQTPAGLYGSGLILETEGTRYM